jgi:hypothetical protein
MFIFARPFWPVAAALGVALLIVCLDRACSSAPTALLDPLFSQLPCQRTPMHSQAPGCFGDVEPGLSERFVNALPFEGLKVAGACYQLNLRRNYQPEPPCAWRRLAWRQPPC